MENQRQTASDRRGTKITRGQFGRLKWLTTILPAVAVFIYETVRHSLLESVLPVAYGNLIVGLLTLILSYGFTEFVFGIIERLQAQALERSRELAVLSAVVEERARLSRELHDGLAQVTAYLLLRIDTVEGLIRSGRSHDATLELERLRASANDLYVDVRESISGLRAQVTEKGLAAVLAAYGCEFGERHGIEVCIEADELPAALSPLTQLQLFGIAQEALANVRRHAGAGHIWVTLCCDAEGRVSLTVADDGRGFDVQQWRDRLVPSFGITMMHERAVVLGGTMRVESGAGEGTRVIVRVPIGDTPIGYGPNAAGSGHAALVG